ncbi:MAG TPA: IS1 family transposase [Pyrinomonadaceae bacterium]|nr:IS1 family transposase [Pyrinomonadaceae bacterium]
MATQMIFDMTCAGCNKIAKKNGKDRYGNQRYRCVICDKTFIEPKDKTLGTMTLAEDKAILCLQLLVEGTSIRSIERITGVHRDTVLSLLETVGKKCLAIQENFVRNVKVKFVQADEIWSFVAMKDKAKHAKEIEDDKIGTAYTFTAIDEETKLIVGWHLGRRNEADALIFLEKVYNAIDGGTKQFQISTDGWKGYDHTVNEVLGAKAHYGQIIKMYGAPNPAEVRYSAAECIGCKKRTVSGRPMKSKISTSHVERQNLTMRMSMRRFTRLTNGFSKKWENHNYAIALHFAHYNFCRGHKTLDGATPAMAANLTRTIWSLKDLLTAATQF